MDQLRVTVGQFSDKGRKSSNQDFVANRLPKNSLLDMKGIALAMADGISSSELSHIASETAVKNFLEDYYCTSEAWSVKGSAERVLTAINCWLYSQTMRSPYRYDKDRGYVCTFSALIIKNHTAHIFNIGDTRVYRLNSDGMEQLTNDHRLWASEEKSYLSRALGMTDPCGFDYQQLAVKPGDLFVIATDGVYEFSSPQQIIDSVQQHANELDAAARQIVSSAYQQGSDDNLSVQLLRVEQLPEQTVSQVKEKIEQLPLPPLLSARMTFDGYSIIREVHASSRSHVYLAQDLQTEKKVILKIPSIDLGGDEDYLERFLLEEWIARRINSAHVLKAELPDRPRHFIYTVFEWIEGQTLSQWAADNPKPKLAEVRGLVEQVAKGLHALHRMEMLHQDIRPENIMIDSVGTVKIIDFGSVSVAGLQETVHQQPLSYLLGTALYSAPEYFLGQAGSTRSELFSLGVLSYFLLSGRYPYGTNVAKAKTRSAQRKLAYRSVLDDEREIPAWIDDAIRRAVNPLPQRRQEQMFEFIHDLRQPSQMFINKSLPPLMERNPVAVWQGISAILALIIVYLLNQ
jgi:serine/threonine protein kinase